MGADNNLSAFSPGSAGVSPAHFFALQPLHANIQESSRSFLGYSEIPGIRICEPARRRRSQAFAGIRCIQK
jgi:hypothetical protein